MKTKGKLLKILVTFAVLFVICVNLVGCANPAGKTYKLKAFASDGEIVFCGDKIAGYEFTKDAVVLKIDKNGTYTIAVDFNVGESGRHFGKGTWNWTKEHPTILYLTNDETKTALTARLNGKELILYEENNLIILENY